MKKIFFSLLMILSSQIFAQTLEPTETLALVSVFITNFKGEPATGGDKITFVSQKTNKEYKGMSDETGKFQILLPKEKFTVYIIGFESDKSDNVLNIPNVEGQINFKYTIRYELPKIYTLENVNFDINKSTIRPESYTSLDNLAELMRRKKTLVIELSGHTDNVGDNAANQKLSEGRASSVKAYLVSKGVPAARIQAVGYGASKPVASNETEVGRQQNRRTEVAIIKE